MWSTLIDVKQLQNISSFCVGILIAYHMYAFKTRTDSTDISNLTTIQYTGPTHLIAELFVRRPTDTHEITMIFHHMFGIFCMYTTLYVDIGSMSVATLSFSSVEISSIFLVLRIWLDDMAKYHTNNDYIWRPLLLMAQHINNMAFIGSFAYTRIYLYSRNLIFDDEYISIIKNNNSSSPMILYYLFNASIYGLYALNIYWFAIILKSLFKKIRNLPLLSARNCEWALQYTYISSFIYAVYRYSSLTIWNPVYWFDIFGYQLVSISSWLFHGKLYRDLVAIYPNTKIDTLDNVPVYLLDIACINARTWLTSYTQYRVVSGYLTSNGATIITTLAIVNTVSFGLYSWYICDMKNKKQAFEIGVNDYRTTIVNIIVGFPIVLNVLYQFINNYNNFYNGLSLFVNIYVCGVVMFIKPFYQANHLALHLLLLWMSVTLVRNNIPVINL